MQEEFEEALNNANFRATLDNHKEKLREKFRADLIVPLGGGYFEINSTLMFEIKLYLDEGKSNFTILDMYLNPVEITNGEEFYTFIRQKYTETLNRYRVDLNNLKRKRNVQKLVRYNLEDDVED